MEGGGRKEEGGKDIGKEGVKGKEEEREKSINEVHYNLRE